jgi:hypothetical protein
VIDNRELVDAIGDLLREYVRKHTELLAKMLHEHKVAQHDVLEQALSKHLEAQHAMIDRLLGKMEALFRPPASKPEAGGRRLDS